MAKVIVCPGYGVGSAEVQIMVDRITHWHSIDYNGNYGTEIYLDTGKSVRVDAWSHDVEKAVVYDATVCRLGRT